MDNVEGGDIPEGYVVHQDLKPQNIFLSLDEDRECPKYPIPMVGDFGSARYLNKVSQSRYVRRSWRNAVTYGWNALEHLELDMCLTGKTNVSTLGTRTVAGVNRDRYSKLAKS